MPVYVVSRVNIVDAQRMDEYVAAAPATVEAFGGRYVVRSGNIEVLEGETSCDRVVVLEFPNREQARAWYESSAYRPLRDLRQRSATASILLVG